MQDRPIFAWRSILTGSTYTVLAGTDNPDAPISNLLDYDLTRPAIPQTDAAGQLQIQFTLDPAQYSIGWGATQYGVIPWGGWSPRVLIIGAHRHEAAGQHDLYDATISLDGGLLDPTLIPVPANTSYLRKLNPVSTTPATITVTITGLPASSYVRIPHLYIGEMLEMPYLELGYEPYPEHVVTADFRSASGRIYRQIRYRQMRFTARWRAIYEPAVLAAASVMIEDAIEQHQPIWWAWAPDSRPHEVYLVDARDVPRWPITQAGMWRDLTIQMDEVL